MTDGAWIIIKNWERYAPRTRNKTAVMPWLRIYRKLLDDRDYRRIEPQYRALLVDLWLLAAESEGKVPADTHALCWRLRVDREWLVSGLQAIATVGFITLPASSVNKSHTSRTQVADKLYAEEKGEEGKGIDKPSATWVTPFLEAWISAFGGVAPTPGRVGRALSPLYREHGTPKVLDHFRFYLSQSNGKASVEHFSQTFGKWNPVTAPTKKPDGFDPSAYSVGE